MSPDGISDIARSARQYYVCLNRNDSIHGRFHDADETRALRNSARGGAGGGAGGMPSGHGRQAGEPTGSSSESQADAYCPGQLERFIPIHVGHVASHGQCSRLRLQNRKLIAGIHKEIFMRMTSLFAGAVVVAMLMVGCEKSESTPATPAAPAKPAAPATPATPAVPATPATPSAAAPVIPPAPDAAAAVAPATQAASAADAEAQKLLDQAIQYVKDNKLDLADSTLTKLEGMKSSLSPTLQKGVDNARSMLTAAKAGGGIKIPSLGGK